MKNKPVLLKITAIREIRPNAYVVLMANIENTKKLPIVIGAPEARAIAFSLENIKSERPITHDLFISLLQSFDIEMEKVSIVKLDRGIFYAEITLKRGDAVINIDARPSDAIAIALRFKRPLFCNSDIMDEAAINTDAELAEQDEESTSDKPEELYENLSISELKFKMQEAAEREDYELAAKIKAFIEKKQTTDKDDTKEANPPEEE
jgi:bifunctional DNase/RNase